MYPVDAKIMIVDDSSFARTMLKNGLKELKFWKILEANGGESAAKLMQEPEQHEDPVVLVILDIHMPDMTGLDFLKWMRNQPATKDTPVIMLTSSQDKSEILVAGKLGVSHYMIKPFDMNMLRERMISTWEKHGKNFMSTLKKAN